MSNLVISPNNIYVEHILETITLKRKSRSFRNQSELLLKVLIAGNYGAKHNYKSSAQIKKEIKIYKKYLTLIRDLRRDYIDDWGYVDFPSDTLQAWVGSLAWKEKDNSTVELMNQHINFMKSNMLFNTDLLSDDNVSLMLNTLDQVKKSPSLNKKQKTGDLEADLIIRRIGSLFQYLTGKKPTYDYPEISRWNHFTHFAHAIWNEIYKPYFEPHNPKNDTKKIPVFIKVGLDHKRYKIFDKKGETLERLREMKTALPKLYILNAVQCDTKIRAWQHDNFKPHDVMRYLQWGAEQTFPEFKFKW